jgi:hypothetical protein
MHRFGLTDQDTDGLTPHGRQALFPAPAASETGTAGSENSLKLRSA